MQLDGEEDDDDNDYNDDELTLASQTHVCLVVCLSVVSHISKTTQPNFTLCSSGFVDDVTFS